jgi:MoxR-like ATPase
MPSNRNQETLKSLINAGQSGLSPELLRHLPQPWHIVGESGEGYEISTPLLRATQVALLLRQPLLLTGDPGVGKTRFAVALATRLKLELQRINVKTTTSGRDLLYMFDDVARFRDAAILKAGDSPKQSAVKPLANYVRFSGLGLAILYSAGPDYQVTPVGFSTAEIAGEEHASATKLSLRDLFPLVFQDLKTSTDSVVLIDELDKAPRDTPNDLLVEIEEMRFDLRELGISIKANPDYWPIVIVTSNSERSFPDPFLRRCIFHHLDFPTDTLPMIIASRIPGVPEGSWLVQDAIERFMAIREQKGLDKVPGTAELIAFIALLVNWGKKLDAPLSLTEEEASQVSGVMGKTRRDEERMRPLLQG